MRDSLDHFDTSEYVGRLEREGFTRQQAEGVIDTLEEVIQGSIQDMQGNLVTRGEQDKVNTTHFNSVLAHSYPS